MMPNNYPYNIVSCRFYIQNKDRSNIVMVNDLYFYKDHNFEVYAKDIDFKIVHRPDGAALINRMHSYSAYAKYGYFHCLTGPARRWEGSNLGPGEYFIEGKYHTQEEFYHQIGKSHLLTFL